MTAPGLRLPAAAPRDTPPYELRTPAWRTAFAVVLASAMGVSVYSIPALAVLSGLLIDDLGIDRSQFGLVVTAVAVSNAACAQVAGRLVDRVGGRRVLLGVFALTVVSAALLAVAPSFWALLALAALAGAPNGASNPATNKVIAEYVPAGRRGGVVGTKQSGVQAGMFLTGVVLPPVALATSWRWSLLLVSAVSVLGLLAAWRLVPAGDRAAVRRAGRAAERPGRLPSAVRWLAAYSSLMGFGGAAVTSFLPLYAHEDLGWSLPAAGAATAAIGLVGMAARIVLGPRMERMGHVALPLAVIAVGSAASVAGLLLAARTPWLVWPAVVVAGLTVATWNAFTMLAAISAGSEQVGRSTGVLVLGFMGGYASSPVLFGTSVEVTGSYLTGWVVCGAVFLAAAGLMLLWRRVVAARP
ncbi:MFS transporter [Geodermatophilus sp. DSM 44513]|uniref:MFS transporter n=1 Tax=Geodermatophilus sp. DSM 44513 TaxID=1528104 RepID=UPI00126E589D|nr:MFS transporter [Geodermatophilus sp. DSM 44513]WNV77103.1 MFS transporter [Geodermatophilus sp. DSM 44513]